MYAVQFEYGVGGEGCVESCVFFDTMDEARKFAIEGVNEICDRVQDGPIADNALLRIWATDVDGELI